MYLVTLPDHWFGPPPALVDGEQWVAHFASNRSQGKRAVGGGLHITTHRLLFCPNVIEAKLGGKPWSCERSEVVSVGVERRRYSPLEMFSGGLRDRLRVDLRDGGRELFVVTAPAVFARELGGLLNVPMSPTVDLPAARVIR